MNLQDFRAKNKTCPCVLKEDLLHRLSHGFCAASTLLHWEIRNTTAAKRNNFYAEHIYDLRENKEKV